jgi:ABC-type polysaccharide/polyol phosphate export permease
MIESVREIWRYRALIGELVRRDLKLRYKNSVGGILWSLANPLLQIVSITLLLRFISSRPISNGSAYLFILFAWNFFFTCVIECCGSILQNATLVRKVYFPRAILPITTLLANLFHFGVAFIFTLIYFFVLRTYPEQLHFSILLAVPVLFFLSCLALGIGFFVAYLNVFYEDVRFIVGIFLQLFIYVIPVFYTIEQVRHKGAHFFGLYMLNPVAALLVTYQRALLGPPTVYGADGKTPLPPVELPWNYFALAGVVSIAVLALGFRLFERHKWEMVERL